MASGESLGGAELRARREALGLTQAALAAALGVTANAVARWERGERAIRQAALVNRALDDLDRGRPRHDHAEFSRTGEPDELAPPSRTRLIGREQDVAALQELLTGNGARLVTLTGPGGTGKTRLALEVAARLASAFPDGTTLVDLSPLTDPRLVLTSIARAMEVRETQETPPLELLQVVFRERSGLVVLDNCEHVLAAMGDLDQLLSPTSQLRVLATSREPLALEGELVVPVGPLAQPDPCDGLGLEDLARVPSVALFVERARAAEPDFALSVENASAVADICTRLHGLPLAIELAAARSSFLTVRAMAARLRERLDVLSSDTQSRPARQQTIEATLAWSYHLLTADEQLVFRRLSVFAGGGTLDAAEAICEVPGILASLASLVRKNLLQMVEQPDGQPRYRMLDLVHLYARDLLRSHAEEAHVRERHAEFFCSLAEVADTQLRSPGHTEWFDRLGWDYDNLRAAMGWADGSGRADLVVRLAGALHPYWSVRGPLTEARAWVQRALASSANETPFARARLASALGTLFWCFREFREATGWHETALALYAEADDTAGQAFSLYNLGIQALQLADPQRAASFLERSTALYARMGDRWGLAGALQGHSWVALQQQDIRRAARLCEQSIAEYRAVGDTRGASGALSNLGEIARQQEQYRRAAALYEQSLEGTRGLGDLAHEALVLGNLGQALLAQGKAHDAAARFRDGLRTAREVHEKRAQAASVAGLGAVACATKRFADAARLLGRAEALVEDLGAPLDLVDRVISERALAQVRQALGEAEADLELSIGRTLSDEDILELGESLATPDSTVSARRDGGLSAREREVAGLVALGYTNQQIADALVISERTANIHVQHILQKLSFNARTQIAAWAVRHQLTPG